MFVSPGMVGKVVAVSENALASEVRKEGVAIEAGPWALVEFENAARVVIDVRTRFEKILTV